MTLSKPRVAIIGAGAIGALLAGKLTAGGADISLVTHHTNLTEAAKAGLRLHLPDAELTVPVRAVDQIEDLEGGFSLCIIATKAGSMLDAARRILPRLTPDSLVVCTQDALCVDELAGLIGESRAVACVTDICAVRESDREIRMTAGREIAVGTLNGHGSPLLGALKELLSGVAPTHISANIYAELYSRLIMSSAMTSICAISGLLPNEVMRRSCARRIFLRITQEAVMTARNLGVEIAPFERLDYTRFIAGDTATDRLRRYLVLRILGASYTRQHSTALQSIAVGRLSEIEWYNGYIVRKGREHGLPCYTNARLVEMVREIRDGKRGVGVANLEDPILVAG